MPSAARIAALLARHGREVTLRFATGVGTFTDITVAAHVMGYRTDPLAPGATPQQGEREIRIAQHALDAAAAPRAPRQGDRITVDGKSLAILSADPRALRGETAIVVIQAKGA